MSQKPLGPGVQGNPDLFLVHEGRIYIFGSPDCFKAFKAKPESFLDPETPGAAAPPATGEALRRGRTLIEKAVEAACGAARVDGVTSYQERAKTSGGPATAVKTASLVLYPNRIRIEQELRFGTLTTVVTPEGGFMTMPRRTAELIEAQREAVEKRFKRSLLPLLRARRDPDFTAVAAGPSGRGFGRTG